MTDTAVAPAADPGPRLDPRKFRDPDVTATGEPRAGVDFVALKTLWFNTGTLCNLTCRGCYIESSPRNDRLVYLSAAEVAETLDEVAREGFATTDIGFTGGEPFMNPELPAMLEDALARGYRVLVLTNAMRPMMKHARALLALRERFGAQLVLRVSVDHYGRALHELERGRHSWQRMMNGLRWLVEHDFAVRIAGRTCWDESEAALRAGYGRLFASLGLDLDANDPEALVLFPEMEADADVPEITERCWDILGQRPEDVMCATSRMVVKRKGATRPSVVSCTLLAYEPAFELGATLVEASTRVALNHPHCARFCVLGGASCGTR